MGKRLVNLIGLGLSLSSVSFTLIAGKAHAYAIAKVHHFNRAYELIFLNLVSDMIGCGYCLINIIINQFKGHTFYIHKSLSYPAKGA